MGESSIAFCKSRIKEHKMASRQIFLWAFLAVTLPLSTKGQNVTDPKLVEFDFPDKPHKLFNDSLYDTAALKMRDNARKLTLDQMDAFLQFGQVLDAAMAEKIRNVTGLTETDSSKLEVDLREAIKSGNISNLMIVDISQHAIAMKQNYVKEVINTINLKPSEFNLTAEQFCDVFDVCQYTTVVISSSTEKFGLGLTDHLKNITGKVDAEPSNSNITQDGILQRRSDSIEATELEQEAAKSSTEIPETSESTETKDEDDKDEEMNDKKEEENEIEKTDPKTDASTQGSSSATIAGLSKYLLLILLVSSHM